MRGALTHERVVFHNYKKKIHASENARLNDNTQELVDRYIKNGICIENSSTAGTMNEKWHFLLGPDICSPGIYQNNTVM